MSKLKCLLKAFSWIPMHHVITQYLQSLLAVLLIYQSSVGMQSPTQYDDYKSHAVQFVADHKIALAASVATIGALGVYKIYTCEPKSKHHITVITKNPIVHLQCTPGYIQNFDTSKIKTASATHASAWSQLETIDITNFLEKGRIFLVEGKKNQELIITLIKIALTNNDLDMLETALYQQEKKISIYSKYKNDGIPDAMVDCIIEYPKTVACTTARPALEILKKSE